MISALGTGAAAAAIGSVNTRVKSVGETIQQVNASLKRTHLETIESFVAQKKTVEQTHGELQKYQQRTTELGRTLAEKKQSQNEATQALTAYQTELKDQATPATEAQRLKLKLLREQAKGAEGDFKKLTREFDASRNTAKGLEQAFQAQVQALDQLRSKLTAAGIATHKLDEHRRRLKATLAQEQASVERLTQRYSRLKAAQEAHTNARADVNSRVGGVMAAWGIGKMMAAPVGAFVRQDEALNALQVAMMDKNGQVHKSYEALKRQAVELGNILPGTTADFVGTARTLMEQGVALESVLGGGLKSASYLSVVLRVPADEAGEMAAKLREAYKLSDSELTQMADSMQRAKFAFGMKPSDLMAASAYQAPMLNQLGISGISNTNKMLAMQGMGAQVGLEGSSWGTNFSMMLSRLAKGPLLIEQAKKGMKAQARGIMDAMGISFDFFDKKGNFAGLDNMVKQLEKLKLIKAKLGDKGAMEVAEAMFGAEAGRPAMILAEAGTSGFEAAQKRMADQASLDERIKKTLESSKNTWESLTGSMENFAAAAAGPAVQSLHPLINGLNSMAGAMTDFAQTNPNAAKWLGLTAAVVAAATVGFLGLGAAMSVGRYALTGFQLLPVVGGGMMQVARGAWWLGGVLKGPLLTGLRLAAQAVWWLGRALLMNPIGLAITAIAVGAYLIYRYWAPIKAFFMGLWTQVKTAFNGGLLGMGKLILNWSPLGLFYKAFAAVLRWFGVKLPADFTGFGAMLLSGLIRGITAKLSAAKAAIVGFGNSIKDWFKSALGIHSPSRVFMGFGDNIGQGASLGILKSLPSMKSAVGKLSGLALAGAAMGVVPAGAGFAAALGGAGGAGGAAATSAGAGRAQVVFSPTIHVTVSGPGAASNAQGQVTQALHLSMAEFERLMQRYLQGKQRTGF